MNSVWDFAGRLVDFVENTSWVEAAFPFGELLFLFHPMPTHKSTGVVPESAYTQYGVDTNNLLLGDNGYPTDLAYYYFGSPV